jgi:hypothetical protein
MNILIPDIDNGRGVIRMDQEQIIGVAILTTVTAASIVVLVLSFASSEFGILERIDFCLWVYGLSVFALGYWLLQVVDLPFPLLVSGAVALALAFVLYIVNDVIETFRDFRAARARRALTTTAPQDPL